MRWHRGWYRSRTWRYYTLGARFRPFVQRMDDGVKFATRGRSGARFLDRCWPVSRPWHRSRLGLKREFYEAALNPRADPINRSSLLAERRRWLPGNPLQNWADRVEDAKRVSEIGR